MQPNAEETGAWEEKLRLGIPGIDNDHMALFRLLSEMRAAVYEGRGEAATAALLDDLVTYVRVHFGREERLLKQHQYPDLEDHVREHNAFARMMIEFQADHRQGIGDLSHDLLDYLNQWLSKHILGTDRKYAGYLDERGVH